MIKRFLYFIVLYAINTIATQICVRYAPDYCVVELPTCDPLAHTPSQVFYGSINEAFQVPILNRHLGDEIIAIMRNSTGCTVQFDSINIALELYNLSDHSDHSEEHLGAVNSMIEYLRQIASIQKFTLEEFINLLNNGANATLIKSISGESVETHIQWHGTPINEKLISVGKTMFPQLDVYHSSKWETMLRFRLDPQGRLNTPVINVTVSPICLKRINNTNPNIRLRLVSGVYQFPQFVEISGPILNSESFKELIYQNQEITIQDLLDQLPCDNATIACYQVLHPPRGPSGVVCISTPNWVLECHVYYEDDYHFKMTNGVVTKPQLDEVLTNLFQGECKAFESNRPFFE